MTFAQPGPQARIVRGPEIIRREGNLAGNDQELRLVLKFLIQPSQLAASPTFLLGIFWCLRQPLPFIIYYYQHQHPDRGSLRPDLIRVLYFFSAYHLLSSISSVCRAASIAIVSDTGIYLTWPQYFIG